MKYLYIGILLFLSFGIQAQDFDGQSEVSVAEAVSFGDHELAEAFELQKITVKFDMHEAFVQNPRILGKEIRESANVATTFKQYLQSQDTAARETLEQELLVFYN